MAGLLISIKKIAYIYLYANSARKPPLYYVLAGYEN